jgi:phosphatidylserine synthase
MMVVAGTPSYLPYVAFSIAAFSALRLAIFNLDERQSDSFRGLPTPANALLLTALPLLPSIALLKDYRVLTFIIILSSYLLVSGIELFALKFKNFSMADNKIRFTFLGSFRITARCIATCSYSGHYTILYRHVVRGAGSLKIALLLFSLLILWV